MRLSVAPCLPCAPTHPADFIIHGIWYLLGSWSRSYEDTEDTLYLFHSSIHFLPLKQMLNSLFYTLILAFWNKAHFYFLIIKNSQTSQFETEIPPLKPVSNFKKWSSVSREGLLMNPQTSVRSISTIQCCHSYHCLGSTTKHPPGKKWPPRKDRSVSLTLMTFGGFRPTRGGRSINRLQSLIQSLDRSKRHRFWKPNSHGDGFKWQWPMMWFRVAGEGVGRLVSRDTCAFELKQAKFGNIFPPQERIPKPCVDQVWKLFLLLIQT